MVHPMADCLLKRAEEVLPYVPQVRSLADEHRREFGFLPGNAYGDAASRENLWVAVDEVSREFRGYLYFGGRHPRMKVFQICVPPEHRSSGIARTIISEFIRYSQRLGYLTITARVLSTLKANRFWQAQGFGIVRQMPSKGAEATINLYAKELDVPSLFRWDRQSFSEPAALRIDPRRPLLPTPSYVIDVNVLFDMIRDRDAGQCAQILASALRHQIRLFVTQEFVAELERNTKDPSADPVLAFARELPTLTRPDAHRMKALVTDLRKLFTSTPPGPRRWTVNDTSDQIHLATSIHHQAFGFITSDGTILRNSGKLHDQYGLHVVCPTDIVDSFEGDDDRSHVATSITSETRKVVVSEIDDGNRADAHTFLMSRASEGREVAAMLAHGPLQSRPESIVVSSSGKIVSMGVWSAMPGPGRDTSLHVYVEEEHPDSDRGIDQILEWGPGVGKRERAWLFNLKIPRDQIRTRETALRRGFHARGQLPASSASIELSRVVNKGVISVGDWRRFRRDFLDLTSLRLPDAMPAYKEMTNTGIVLGCAGDVPSFTMSLFDFETFISPGYLLGPGREAVIVPIREGYSDELLPPTRRQGLLFSQNEAAFRLERAYFLRAGMHKRLPRGSIVVFYVSHARHEAVALARVTYSATLTKMQALLNLTRQGVLTEAEIHQRANDRDEIAVFSFDNVLAFRQSVDFHKLKDMGCVDRTNLVTAQAISDESFGRIVGEAFGSE